MGVTETVAESVPVQHESSSVPPAPEYVLVEDGSQFFKPFWTAEAASLEDMLRKLHARHPDVPVPHTPTPRELQLQFIKWLLARPHISPLASPASSGFYTDMFGVRPQPGQRGSGFFDEHHASDERAIRPPSTTHQSPLQKTGFFDEEYVSGKRPASPSAYEQRRSHCDSVLPAFETGMHVMFCDSKTAKSGSGVISRIIKPGEQGNPYRSLQGASDPANEVLYELDSGASAIPRSTG